MAKKNAGATSPDVYVTTTQFLEKTDGSKISDAKMPKWIVDEFTDEDKTLKSVRYHLDKLKREGFIHFKYDGRIIDLER